MEFKNDQFEREASKTLSTLEALKQKLNDNFSTKGAEELNQAIKTVDVSPITKGLEAVQVQFSALQIAGKRVIENIVDAAMNGIANVKNKLMGVVNQIKVGGANRAQNIENAKFMLSGLGIEWVDIVDDINYGVQDTAYGLDAAAKVASQLVASNVTLGKEMQSSLRAVSGVAAMTNSTYEEIGHIFTAIAGQGKLMTMQLQQFSLRGLNVAADLAKAMGTTEAAIREMVTKGQIDFQTFANAMDELYGEHAKEANKTFSGALSNTKAALSRLGADIQAQKFETLRTVLLEVTAKLKELKKALAPVEESINNMIAAVGKLVESFIKSLDIKGIVDKIAPKVQSFCDLVTRVGDAWREIREEEKKLNAIVYDNGYTAYYTARAEAFGNSTDEIVEAVDKLAALSDDELAKFKQNAWDIWTEGKYGNGQDRIDALKGDYELTQEYVEKMIELGWDQEKMDEYIAAQRKKRDEQVQVKKRVDEIKSTVKNVLAIFDNLKIVMHNIFSSIVNVVSAAFGGLSESFTNVGLLGAVVNMTAKLAEFSNKIAITKDKAEKIRPVAKAIGDILKVIAKGLYNCIKFLVNFISAAAKNDVVIAIFTAIKKAILAIFDGLKKLYTKLKESGAWDKFVDILKLVAEWIGDKIIAAFDKMSDLAPIVADKTASAFEKIINKIKDFVTGTEEGNTLLEKMAGLLKSGVDISKTWIGKLGDGLKKIFGNSEDEESVFKTAYIKAAAFGRGLIEGINSITWDDIKEAGGIALKLYSVISLLNLIGSWTSINRSITKFFKGLSDFFYGLSGLTKAATLRTVASALESLGRTLLMIVTSIVALTLIIAYAPGGDEAVNKAIGLVREFVILLGFFEVLITLVEKTKLVNKGKKISITLNARKLAMAMMLTSIATFMWTFFQYVKFTMKGLTSEDSDKFTGAMIASLGIMLAMFGMITLMITVIMQQAEKLKGSLVGPELLNAMTKTINAITKAMFKMMLTIALLTMVFNYADPKASTKAMFAFIEVITALLILVGWAALISANMTEAKAKDIDIITGFFTVFSGAMTMLMLGLAAMTVVFHKVSSGAIIFALVTFAAIFAALIGGLVLINNIHITNEKSFEDKMKAIMKIVAAMSILIVSFAGLVAAIGMMKSLGVEINEFLKIIAVMLGAVVVLTAVGGIAGMIGGTAGIEAVSHVLAAFGVAMLGVAANILVLALAFKIIIDTLPKFVSAFETFHNQILEKKDVVVAGIGDLIGVIAQGLFVGIIQALNALISNIEPIVEALIDTIIVICNVLGAALKSRAGELGEAIANLLEGIVVVVIDAVAGAIKGIIAGIWDAIEDIRAYIGLNGTDEYYEEGQTEDAYAEAMLSRIKSEKIDKHQKEAAKLWLKEHGYDENGERTGEWLELHTKIPYSELITWEEAKEKTAPTKSEQYAAYYGGNNRGATPFTKTKEELKDIKKDAEEAQTDSAAAAEALQGTSNNVDLISTLTGGIQKAVNGANTNLEGADITGYEENMNSLMGMFNVNADNSNLENYEGYSSLVNEEAESMSNSVEEYNAAVKAKTDALENNIKNMAENIGNTFKTLSDDSKEYGRGVINGLVDGMTEIAATVKLQKACKEVVDVVKNGITNKKDGLDERSPSHVMEKFGLFAILGLAKGISDSTGLAADATEEAGKATIMTMRDTIRRISAEALNGIDEPRITPILDLSNVTEGMSTMNGLFDTTHAYRLGMLTSGEAKLTSSSKVSSMYQNGSNFSDENTVAAINNLNGEVSTLKDAINGMQVVIDGRALVGQISTPMDKALGRKAMAGRRGR